MIVTFPGLDDDSMKRVAEQLTKVDAEKRHDTIIAYGGEVVPITTEPSHCPQCGLQYAHEPKEPEPKPIPPYLCQKCGKAPQDGIRTMGDKAYTDYCYCIDIKPITDDGTMPRAGSKDD